MTEAYYTPKIETMSQDAVAAMQLEKLGGQLTYLQKSVPFYANRFREAGAEPEDITSFAALANLPLVEKQDLRDSQAETPPLGRHSGANLKDVVRIHASSGTTGTPSFVGITAFDKTRWIECIARSYWAQGLRKNDIFAMGMSIGFFVGGLPIANVVEEIGATLLPIGTGASDRLLQSIERTRASVLATTPSYALHLAELAEDKMGMDVGTLGVRKVFVGAEPGGGIPAIRAKIEAAWNATCTESIGNADVITIHSAECEARDGCHFMVPDYLIMEIIDPDTGDALPMDRAELEGEMVFTHLDRQCNPMLRFRTRDRVVIKTTPCACGRTGPRMRCIGRSDDLLIVRGVNVWPSAVRDVLMSFQPDLNGEMRIRLDAPPPMVASPLEITAECGQGVAPDPALARRVEERMREKLIFKARVRLVPHGALPRTEMKAALLEHRYRT